MSRSRLKVKDVGIDYLQAFPTWRVLDRHELVRLDGPVLQGVCFQGSSSDDYRPTSFVRILCKPYSDRSHLTGALELATFLTYKNGASRSVELRNHVQERDDVISEMKRQFLPRMDLPLRAEDVLLLYEDSAVRTEPQCASLAFLNAYFGRMARAALWCQKGIQLATQPYWRDIEWTQVVKRDLEQLLAWIASGSATTEAYRIADENIHAIGLDAPPETPAR